MLLEAKHDSIEINSEGGRGGKNYGVPGPGIRIGLETLFLVLKKGANTFFGFLEKDKYFSLLFEKGDKDFFGP